jgi:16S rRNA (uracil1498-N3)-methyltransferase
LGPRTLDDPSTWRLDTYFVPEDAGGGPRVRLRGPEARHAVSAARTRPGDAVRLIDGCGWEALALIESIGRDEATLTVIDSRVHDASDGVALTLVQAMPKGRAFSEIVRRAAELGVAAVVPVTSERTVVRPSTDGAEARLGRWRSVALAATKQSRGVFATRVEPVIALRDAGPLVSSFDRAIVAWEQGGVALRHVLAGPRPRTMVVVVGAEGGLSAAEVGGLGALGAVAVGLGRRVLRADWAGAAISAAISFSFGGLLP